jgi:hypothetical protein
MNHVRNLYLVFSIFVSFDGARELHRPVRGDLPAPAQPASQHREESKSGEQEDQTHLQQSRHYTDKESMQHFDLEVCDDCADRISDSLGITLRPV